MRHGVGFGTGAELRDRLGVAHVDGKYFLTSGDYLNEGADQVLKTGSRSIKVYLTPARYPWNSAWPTDLKSLEEIAKTPYFQKLFAKPFTTFIITAYSIGRKDHYWTTGVPPADLAEETRQFHDLTKYLLTTYQGSGKTFVLQHWEGDWALRDEENHIYDAKFTPTQTSIDGMIAWLNARQAGIAAAQAGSGGDRRSRLRRTANPTAYAMRWMANRAWRMSVLPHTTVDLASYSSWDTQDDAAELAKAVDFLAAHLPSTAVFGQNTHSVYIGEFGAPENVRGEARVNQNIDNVVRVMQAKELPWAIYWEIYCNELADNAPPPPVNGKDDAVKGFWMIKPDGTPGEAWHRYRELLANPR